MKLLKPSLFLLIFPLALSFQCMKKVDELDKLPPATQEGKNTFGCLVNGKAWIPSGNDGAYPNYRIIIEPDPLGISLDVRTFKYSDAIKEEILFASVPFKGVGTYSFSDPTKQSFGYIGNGCRILRSDVAYRNGFLNITRFD